MIHMGAMIAAVLTTLPVTFGHFAARKDTKEEEDDGSDSDGDGTVGMLYSSLSSETLYPNNENEHQEASVSAPIASSSSRFRGLNALAAELSRDNVQVLLFSSNG